MLMFRREITNYNTTLALLLHSWERVTLINTIILGSVSMCQVRWRISVETEPKVGLIDTGTEKVP